MAAVETRPTAEGFAKRADAGGPSLATVCFAAAAPEAGLVAPAPAAGVEAAERGCAELRRRRANISEPSAASSCLATQHVHLCVATNKFLRPNRCCSSSASFSDTCFAVAAAITCQQHAKWPCGGHPAAPPYTLPPPCRRCRVRAAAPCAARLAGRAGRGLLGAPRHHLDTSRRV